MKALPALCPRELAWRRLAGLAPRLAAWNRRRRSEAVKAARLELVYLAEYAALVTSPRGKRHRRAWLAINVPTSTVYLLGTDEPAWQTIDDGDELAAPGSPRTAADLLRRHARASRLRRAAWLMTRVAHPYWAYYVSRAGDRLDVRLLDAIHGRPTATGLKLVFLEALMRTEGRRTG